MALQAIILAAGHGKRMVGTVPKVLMPLADSPMLAHVIHTAEAIDCTSITVVISPSLQKGYGESLDTLKRPHLNYVTQTSALGTGAAVATALENSTSTDLGIILYGDVPCIPTAALTQLIEQHQPNALGILTAQIKQGGDLGRIIRNATGEITAIREAKDASPREQEISEINTGIMLGPVAQIKQALQELAEQHHPLSQPGHEFYLTDLVEHWIAQQNPVYSVACAPAELALGANTPEQLYNLERSYYRNRALHLLKQGVMFANLDNVFIRGPIKVGNQVSIGTGVDLTGPIEIEDNVKIGNHCSISKSTIGNHTIIYSTCIISESTIGPNNKIGPFSHIRPGTKLTQDVKIGSFVELKASTISKGTKVHHFAYIGDATIGEQVNWGAFSLTCNYDGIKKHHTQVENNCFVGSGCQLIAPIRVGKGAFLAAGSTYNQDITPQSKMIARCRQQPLSSSK